MTYPLQNLISLTEPAVYALINDIDGYAYVSHSNNPMKAIGILMKDLSYSRNAKYKNLIKDRDKLRLEIIKSTESTSQRKLDADNYVRLLASRGIKLYNRMTGIKYRLVSDIVGYKVHLSLVSRRNDKRLIGVFDSFIDSIEFTNLYYRDLNSFFEVCALNKATKVYFKRLKNTVVGRYRR